MIPRLKKTIKTPPDCSKRGKDMLKLTKETIKRSHILAGIGTPCISLVVGKLIWFSTAFAFWKTWVFVVYNLKFSLAIFDKHVLFTSFSKCYLRLRNNLTLYIYYKPDFVSRMSTHKMRLMVWLNDLKKTCQAHFFEVEAKLKNWCGYFAHQFVILLGSDLTISNYSLVRCGARLGGEV